MAQVILPRSLAALVPGVERRTSVAGTTVGELIAALDARWPGIADRLCDSGPSIRVHINVFVDGERAGTLDQPVGPDATVHVIPAIAGGSGDPPGVEDFTAGTLPVNPEPARWSAKGRNDAPPAPRRRRPTGRPPRAQPES